MIGMEENELNIFKVEQKKLKEKLEERRKYPPGGQTEATHRRSRKDPYANCGSW